MTLSASQAIQQALQTDTWVNATWDEFVATMEKPQFEEGRGYFDNNDMRVEMAPLGAGHGRHNSVLSKVVSLFAMLRNIRIVEFVNCSFYKTKTRSCQPDLAFYIGEEFQLPPQDNSPINVDSFGPPSLVVELGASSFNDDLGAKRLLYERLGVAEYWVVNVAERSLIAFAIANGRSGEVKTSEVLPGLDMALVEEALGRSQVENDSTLMRWLMDTLR
ncbi:MAG: Uma2 family endonuclease [Elainellaceae cyanobacterium]